ncbi:MAG: hypothetical protein NC548_43950 [Lachnospiraceae bacterium]|nr:hypothetical protein [Lachnospiraceae bacterium]
MPGNGGCGHSGGAEGRRFPFAVRSGGAVFALGAVTIWGRQVLFFSILYQICTRQWNVVAESADIP